MTEYVVLRDVEGPDSVARYEVLSWGRSAESAKEACEEAMLERGMDAGQIERCVAIPTRYWQPMVVRATVSVAAEPAYAVTADA